MPARNLALIARYQLIVLVRLFGVVLKLIGSRSAVSDFVVVVIALFGCGHHLVIGGALRLGASDADLKRLIGR